MSAVFSRPSIIQGGSSVSLPNARLDQPATSADIPSPVVAKILENQLATQLPDLAVASGPNLSAKLAFVENWMASLPRVFNIHNTDTRWDAEHPRLVFQRLQLHCVGYMTLLMFLRPYLTSPNSHCAVTQASRSNNEEEEAETRRLVACAIDTALSLMSASTDFFALCFPDKVKYFMVSFCPFDTAALLCSAMLHDNERAVIPRRLEVIEAIGCALQISNRLLGLTKMGNTTWSILTRLVSRLDLLPEEREILEAASRSGELVIPRANVSTRPRGDRRSNVDSGGRVLLEIGGSELDDNTTANLPAAEPVWSDETRGIIEIKGETWNETFGKSGATLEIELAVLDGL